MKQKFTKVFLLVILTWLAVGGPANLNAQCNFASPYATMATAPALGITSTFSTCSYGGEYSTCTGGFVVGGSYITTSSVATDWITVRSGTPGGTVVAFGQTPLTFIAPTTGPLYFHWSTDNACGTQNSCRITTLKYDALPVLGPPTISSFAPSTACAGTTPVVITGTNFTGATGVTFGGVAAASFTVNSPTQITATPSVSAVSGVIAVTTSGGTGTSAGSLTVNSAPTVSISASSTSVCLNQSTTLTASGSVGNSYVFNPGSLSGAVQTVTPTTNTTYTVVATGSNGCTFTATQLISVDPIPVFSTTTATPNLLCPGDVTALATAATLTTGATGPGPYTISAIPYSPVVPAGSTSAGPTGDDNLSAAITLPFPFTFYGVVKNNVYISTNGYISFDPAAGAGCCTGQVLPNTLAPNDVIAANWEDLNILTGEIDYFTFGVAPNRKFVVRWNAATWFGGGGSNVTSQIVLNESDQSIEIHGTSGGPIASNNTTVGIENSTGTLGTAVPGKNSTSPWTFANEAWKFSQFIVTPVSNYAWDGGLTGNVATPSVQNTNANPSAATTYTVTATASNGCTQTATVSVSTKPFLTGTASATPTSICIGSSTVLNGNVPNVCSGSDATFAGTYAPATWTFSNGGGTGTVNTASAPASIQLLSGNNGGLGSLYTSYAHNVVCAGNMVFDWSTSASPNNIAALSYPQYRINSGAWVTLTGFNTGGASVAQSGTQTIAAAAGDMIEIAAQTVTGDAFDAYTLTLSNFSAPTLPASGFVDFWDAPTGGTLLGTPPYTATPGSVGTATYYAQFNTSTSTGCTNPVRTPVVVTVNALPSVTATATPAAICLGSSSTLTGGGASTYLWDGTNPDPYTVSPTSTTSYTVTGTDGNGCSATSSVSVTVNPLPVITSLTATPDPICPNGTSTLAVLPGLAGGSSYCNSNFTSVTYEFLTNVTFAGINNTSAGTIGGPVNYTAQTASVTAGVASTLSVTMDPDANDYIYAWIDWNQNGTLNDAGETYTLASSSSAAGPHILSITPPVTALNGNTRMRVMVDWNNATPNPCRSATWGEAEDYTVSVSGGVTPPPTFASITWSPATFLNATNTATVTASAVTATTAYTVQGTDANGCTITSSVTLTMTPAPTGNTFADPIVTTLPASTSGDNMATNCWSSTYTGTNAQSSPDVFYQFVMPSCNDSLVVSTCGTLFDTYIHLLDNTGTQIASNDDGCAPASVINFTGLTPGATYYAVVEGWGTSTGSYNLSINSYQSSTLVVAGVSASPNPVCENATVTLTGTGAGVGGSYSYSGPATVTAGQFTATLSSAGIYTVTATTAAGCTATATTSVVVNALPAVTASVSATPICLGSSTTFTGGGATSYTWTDGTNTPTDGVAFTPSTASVSTYTVTGTDANGCSNTSTVGLTVNALPSVTASATPNPACVGGDITFAGGGATTYAWTDGTNTPTDGTPFTMTTAGTSTYTVTGTDGAGCSATSTVSVSVNPSATFNAPVTLSSSCPGALGASLLIGSTGGTGTVTYAISPNYPTQPVSGIFNGMIGNDSYTITLSDALGCTATTSLTGPVLTANGGLANATAGNTASTPGNTCQNQGQPDATAMSFYGANCGSIIATIVDNPGTPLGNVNACVTVSPTVPTYNGQPFIPRYYDILPQNQGGATITFYFTHDDILDFNANAGSYPQIASVPAVPMNGNTISFLCSQVPQGFLPGAPSANTVLHNVTATWNDALQRWEASVVVASFSGFYFHTGSVPLPATITKFNGRKLNSSDMLEWTSASEQNNAYFNLQHSTNGVDFKTIAKVNSKASNGNSQTELSYSYEHATPSLGHNYYRLEQVDIDNQSTINAKIVDIIWGANGNTVSLYPNPTQDVLNIDLYTSKVQNTTVKVLDMSGRIVKQIQARSEVGMSTLSISLGELSSGVYTVQVYDNDKLSHVGKVKKN